MKANLNASYKTKICKFYKEYDKCKNGENCSYAHDINELKIINLKDCKYGIFCNYKDCMFNHPKERKYIQDKNICKYYIQGRCEKNNECNYNHINIENNIKEKKINISDTNEFPYLDNQVKNNKINDSINPNGTITNKIQEIKKELKNNYIYLKRLDPTSWADDFEIEKTNEDIKILKNQYYELKNIDKNENNEIYIDNNDLYLDILFKCSDTYINNKINVNINENNNIENSEKETDINPLDMIVEMKIQTNLNITEIKKNINKIFNDKNNHHLKIKFISDLNMIRTNIQKLEYDYKDLIN